MSEISLTSPVKNCVLQICPSMAIIPIQLQQSVLGKTGQLGIRRQHCGLVEKTVDWDWEVLGFIPGFATGFLQVTLAKSFYLSGLHFPICTIGRMMFLSQTYQWKKLSIIIISWPLHCTDDKLSTCPILRRFTCFTEWTPLLLHFIASSALYTALHSHAHTIQHCIFTFPH